MSDKNNLDLKFLDLSLQKYENDRHAFFRNLKIAAVLVITFQFLVFFPYIDISDEKYHATIEINVLKNDSSAINDFQSQLITLQGSLYTGRNIVFEKLQKLPDDLKTEINLLEDYVNRIREVTIPDSSIDSSGFEPSRSTIQRNNRDHVNVKAPRLPRNLKLADKEEQILKTSSFEDSLFQSLIEEIVNERLIPPLFENINNLKIKYLNTRSNTENKKLIEILFERRDILETLDFDIDSIEQMLVNLKTGIASLNIKAPFSKNWWTFYKGKQAVSQALKVDVEKSVDEYTIGLGKIESDLSLIGSELKEEIEEVKKRFNQLNSEKAILESKFEEIQSAMQSYTVNFQFITLKAQQGVIFYPLILALVLAYFVWSYLRLYRRARYLNAEFTNRGTSKQILQNYFHIDPHLKVGPTGKQNIIYHVRRIYRMIYIIIIWMVPSALAIISTNRLLTSTSLKNDAPIWMFMVTSAIFILFYLILTNYFLLKKSGSIKNINGTTSD